MTRPLSSPRPSIPTLLMIGVIAALVGCSSSGSAAGSFGAGAGDDEVESGGRYLITRSEIEAQASSNALVIVRNLRASWLRARTGGAPEVFLDEVHYGPIRTLDTFNTSNIERIEFIEGRDATTLYGTGYTGGIIKVITLR